MIGVPLLLNTIYKITNNTNGKVYIGKTSLSVEKRFQQHINDSKKERFEKRPLYDAIRKYGIDNFSVDIVETNISDEEINDKEIFYIKENNSYIGFENSNGYNATLGGDSRKYKDFSVENIILDYENGLNCSEIGRKYNIDYSYVSDILKSNGIKVLNSRELCSKEIYQIDKLTNKIIAKFKNPKEASIKLFGNSNKKSGIKNALLGYQNTAFGYKWIFA